MHKGFFFRAIFPVSALNRDRERRLYDLHFMSNIALSQSQNPIYNSDFFSYLIATKMAKKNCLVLSTGEDPPLGGRGNKD